MSNNSVNGKYIAPSRGKGRENIILINKQIKEAANRNIWRFYAANSNR